jgi:hypothetical protein
MQSLRVAVLASVAALLMVAGSEDVTQADHRRVRSLRADLHGFEEPPAVSSTGSGHFQARINRDGTGFDYELSYEDLEGTVTQAHIHLGQRGVNGGISIWLCETATNPSPVATTPTCEGPNSGMVQGTVIAADVVGPAGQGVAVAEFAEILRAMRTGVTYANVHTTKHPGGEIRGQVRGGGGGGRDDDDDD